MKLIITGKLKIHGKLFVVEYDNPLWSEDPYNYIHHYNLNSLKSCPETVIIIIIATTSYH